MATYNAMPPKPTAASQTSITTTVSGRTYTCAIGSSIQVPDFDAFELSSNGWGVIEYIPVGGTRPVHPPMWKIYFDATPGDNHLVERLGMGSPLKRQRRLAHKGFAAPLLASKGRRRAFGKQSGAVIFPQLNFNAIFAISRARDDSRAFGAGDAWQDASRRVATIWTRCAPLPRRSAPIRKPLASTTAGRHTSPPRKAAFTR
jgi:hypothetical protein